MTKYHAMARVVGILAFQNAEELAYSIRCDFFGRGRACSPISLGREISIKGSFPPASGILALV
jgi:hypothetical protein